MDNIFEIKTILNLDDFNRSLLSLQNKLKRLQGKDLSAVSPIDTKDLKEAGDALDKTKKGIEDVGKKGKDATTPVKDLNSAIKGTSNTLGDVARRVFVWGSLSAAIFQTIIYMKEMLEFTIEVNRQMAELKKVIPRTEDFASIKAGVFKISVEFGQKPEDVIRTLNTFAQAGLETQEAIEATKTAMLALNVTGADTETVIGALIGASRIFNVEWTNMESVIDKVQKVQAEFAVSSEDLVKAITTVGPVVTNLGGNLDDLLGTIAAMAEVSRVSGKEAANSLKTILAKMTTPEGLEELQKLGVAVMETSGEFRPLRDVMQDFSDAVKNSSQAEKFNIALKIAQVRQYPKLLALLDSYLLATKAIADSEGAFGEAARANQSVMESYAKRMEISSAKTKEFWETMLVGGENIAGVSVSVKEFAGFLASIGLAIDKVVPGLIQVAGAAGVFALALKGIKIAVIGFDKDVRKAFSDKSVFSLMFRSATETIEKDGKKINTVFSQMKGNLLGFGVIGVGLLALTPIISAIVDHFSAFGKKVEETRKGVESFKKSLESIKFTSIDPAETNRRFTVFLQTFETLRNLFKQGKLDADAFDKVFKQSFEIQGPFSEDQIKTIGALIEKYKELQLQVRAKPLTDFLDIKESELTKGFNRVIEIAEKTGEKSGSIFSQKFNIALTEALFSVRSRAGLASQALGADVPFDILQGQVSKVTNSIEPLIKNITRLKQEINSLQFIGGNEIKIQGLTQDLNTNVEKAADAFLPLIVNSDEFQRKIKEMSEISQEAFKKEALLGSAEADTQSLILVLEQLKKKLREVALSSIVKEEDRKLIEEMVKILNIDMIKAANEVKKAFLVAFDITETLNAARRSISQVIGAFNTEISVVSSLSAAFKNAGVAYDLYGAKLKAVENFTKELTVRMKENQEALAKAEGEVSTLQAMIKAAQGLDFSRADTRAQVSTEHIGRLTEELEEAVSKVETLGQVIDNDNKLLTRVLPTAAKLKEIFEATVEEQKRQEEAIKANLKLHEETAKQALETIKVLSQTRSLEGFETIKKSYDSILDAQSQYVRNLIEIEKISQSQADTLLFGFQTENTLQKAILARQLILDEITAIYERHLEISEKTAEAQVEIKKKIAESSLELVKGLKGSDRQSVLDAEIKAIELKAQAELQSLSTLRANQIITDDVYQKRIALVNLEKDSALIGAVINDELERRSKIYEGVSSDVMSIKGHVADWLSNQKELLDDLASRGSLLKVANRLIGGIVDVMAKRDAEIIAESLGGQIQSWVEKARFGITQGFEDVQESFSLQLQDSLNKVNLPDRLYDKIKLASDYLTSNTSEGLIKAGEVLGLSITESIKRGIRESENVDIPTVTERSVPSLELEGGLSEGFFTKLLTDKFELLLDRQKKNLKTIEDNTAQIASNTGGKAIIMQTQDSKKFTPIDPDERALLASTAQSTSLLNTKIEEGFKKAVQDNTYTTISKNVIKETAKTTSVLGRNEEQLDNLLAVTAASASTMLTSRNVLDRIEALNRLQVSQLANLGVLTNKSTEEISGKSQQGNKELQNALLSLGGSLAKTLILSQISQAGKSTEAAEFLGGAGTIVGGAIGGPIGSVIGGILGTALGGLFGGKEKQERMAQDILAISENTAALVERLSPDIINAPANFVLPSSKTLSGGSIVITNNFNISGQASSQQALDTLTKQVNDLYGRSASSVSIMR